MPSEISLGNNQITFKLFQPRSDVSHLLKFVFESFLGALGENNVREREGVVTCLTIYLMLANCEKETESSFDCNMRV